MDSKNKMPDGYYHEIEYPFERKSDTKALFCNYEVREHTNKETEYSYMEDNDVELEIVNPNCDRNLYIEFAGRFTLFYGGWHTHYDPYEYDYGEMKKDTLAIVSGKYGAISLYIEDQWHGCHFLTERIVLPATPDILLAMIDLSEDRLQEIKEKGAVLWLSYWDENTTYRIDGVSRSEGDT